MNTKHINRALSHENITIIKRDIREVYHDEFDDALNTYNLKQRRKDRKLKTTTNTLKIKDIRSAT